jgi:hypothetical protein
MPEGAGGVLAMASEAGEVILLEVVGATTAMAK